MSFNFFTAHRLSSQILNSVTSHLQCIRTAATLKYFHPIHPVSPPSELWGQGVLSMPPYPYGPNRYYPAADTGLYGGAQVQSGNKISKGRNKGKSLRRWYPNVRLEKVRSVALDREFTIKITAACMRTINKCGGLDQYLLGEKPARIKELGLLGWRLRWRVLTSKRHQKAPKADQPEGKDHAMLDKSLPRVGESSSEAFERAWARPEVRKELLDLQKEQWSKLQEKNARFEEHIRKHWLPADGSELKIPEMAALMNWDPEKIEIPDPKSATQWKRRKA